MHLTMLLLVLVYQPIHILMLNFIHLILITKPTHLSLLLLIMGWPHSDRFNQCIPARESVNYHSWLAFPTPIPSPYISMEFPDLI